MAIVLAVYLYSPVSATLNGYVLDTQFKVLRNLSPTPVNDNIVVIGIDEQSYDVFDRPSGLWHSYLGELMLGIAGAEPELLIVDLLLEKLYKDIVPNHYSSLHRGLLAFRKSQTPLVMAIGLKDSTRSTAFGLNSQETVLEEVFPYPAMRTILRGEEHYGLAVLEKDLDGVMRRQSMEYESCTTCSPSMLARAYEQLGEKHPPGLINFALGAKFQYVPLHEVVRWYRQGQEDKLDETFAGKAVFLGSVTRFDDRHLAPVSLASWEDNNRKTPGVLFMAQAMRSINEGGLIQPISNLGAIGLLCLALGFWFIATSLRFGTASLIAFVLLMLAGSTWLLTIQRELPTGLILVAAIVASATRFSFEAVASFLERKRLTASFGGYVSQNVMKQILDGKITPDMQGVRLNVCVMFADIRNFTSRSESATPESIIKLLNYYFGEMTDAVDEFGGTVDKFVGDGLMVFFGAPNVSSNPSQNALDAVKSMMRRLEAVNTTLAAEGIEAIEIGIGLHTGEAVIGHVGSARRHEYTAIGDTVNVAARLEGLTKALRCTLVCSEVVFNNVAEKEQLTALGEHNLKGHTAIPVYGWSPENIS